MTESIRKGVETAPSPESKNSESMACKVLVRGGKASLVDTSEYTSPHDMSCFKLPTRLRRRPHSSAPLKLLSLLT